jgi:hypothetical protein
VPRNRAYLLVQLRIGHCWLALYSKIYKFQEDDRCYYGPEETINHIILDCPTLRIPRQSLRREIGDAFDDIPTMLGGKGNTNHAKAVVDFEKGSHS